MTLAVQVEKLSRSDQDVTLLRQQAENQIQVSYHSLRELAGHGVKSLANSADDWKDEAGEPTQGDETKTDNQVEIWKAESDDTAAWLYDLVFSPVAEAYSVSNETPSAATFANGRQSIEELPERSLPCEADALSDSNALVLRRGDTTQQFQLLLQEPPSSKRVVNELLSGWTTLTEDEIDGVENYENNAAEKYKMAPIRFKDDIGRNFAFPFHLSQTWEGLEELIKEAFVRRPFTRRRVVAGQYDIIGPAGEIILPSVWKDFVEPGWEVTQGLRRRRETKKAN
ncbi:hypothetical protein DL764_008034 [Monosporascus ibericus]|uniref:Ubiquitin-like domain-containing protein n=1 Tax=Monosporascus ibericus TaxID=155417 RepID=A0A4Q4T1I9_9PEZI|nr:hypothetical protein DL764_008034 [Monosporascus ibericus]